MLGATQKMKILDGSSVMCPCVEQTPWKTAMKPAPIAPSTSVDPPAETKQTTGATSPPLSLVELAKDGTVKNHTGICMILRCIQNRLWRKTTAATLALDREENTGLGVSLRIQTNDSIIVRCPFVRMILFQGEPVALHPTSSLTIEGTLLCRRLEETAGHGA